MRRRHKSLIKQYLQSFFEEALLLPFGRRLILGSTFFAFLFLFFPWFSSSTGELGVQNYNAFNKVPIFGILLFSSSVGSFLIILREIFSKKSFIGSFSHNGILVFLLGQGVYTVLIATFVFHEFASLMSRFDEVRIGIGLTFISLGIALTGALFSKDFMPSTPEKKVYANPQDINTENVNLEPEKKSSQLSIDSYE